MQDDFQPALQSDQQNLSPEDKFFLTLERNLQNYIQDRVAAYEFVTRQLE